VRLGRQQMDRRFDRFMVAAAKLVSQRATDIAYVDMRYSNGFAVGWKGGAAHGTEHSGERTASSTPDHSDG
jgi:cell division protein FtsQ